MLPIEYYAHKSKLRKINPLRKQALSVGLLFCCLLINSIWFSLFCIIGAAVAVVAGGGMSLRAYLKMLRVPFLFIFFAGFAVMICFGAQSAGFVLFSVGKTDVFVTSESCMRALSLFLRSFGCVSCLYFLSLTTPFNKQLAAFQKMRVPAFFLELLLLMYRFILLLLESAREIRTAQQARLGYRSFHAAVHSFAGLVAMSFVKAYKRSDDLYQAMESRLYDGKIYILED